MAVNSGNMPVPVPVYCRPLMEKEPGMKVSRFYLLHFIEMHLNATAYIHLQADPTANILHQVPQSDIKVHLLGVVQILCHF